MTEVSIDHLPASFKQKLDEEPAKIQSARKNGQKVAGYFCPYVPEELILAAGMLPVRLAFAGTAGHTGKGKTTGRNAQFEPKCPCPDVAQLKNNPYFETLDLICVADSCLSMAETLRHYEEAFDLPVLALELPSSHSRFRVEPENAYFFGSQLEQMKKRLSGHSGLSAGRGPLMKALRLCRNIREMMRRLYEYPMAENPPVTWRQVLAINQAGFLINRQDFLAELEKFEEGLATPASEELPADIRPRLMIAGSSIGIGDNKLLDVLDKSGGNVVADFTCNGSMLARKRTPVFGPVERPIPSLVEQYLYNAPCPVLGDLDNRLERLLRFAHYFRIHGLIYYDLAGCSAWRADFEKTEDTVYQRLSVPALLVETDLSPSGKTALSKKVKAFIEIIGGQV